VGCWSSLLTGEGGEGGGGAKAYDGEKAWFSIIQYSLPLAHWPLPIRTELRKYLWFGVFQIE
jgi:hypothetical protein